MILFTANLNIYINNLLPEIVRFINFFALPDANDLE
jgi:hypothetical protein